MTLALNFEDKMSFRPSYVPFNTTISIIDVKKIKESSTDITPQKLMDVMEGLFEQIKQEILIPILRAKNSEQLEREIINKFPEFYELRNSIVSAFSSLLRKDDNFSKRLEINENRVRQDINLFFENEASKYLGEETTLSIIFALRTQEKVKNGFLELQKQNIIDDKFFKDHIKTLYEFGSYRTGFDLLICCLILGLKEGVTFSIEPTILNRLASLCEGVSVAIYNLAKQIGVIRYPQIVSTEEIYMETDEEDKYLAEAGLKDYIQILKREDDWAINRGDVYIAELNDDTVGSEQKGLRPVIIIQSDVLNKTSLTTRVMIPTTGYTPQKAKHFTNVHLKKGEGGLTQDSLALCIQIRALDKPRFRNKLGELTKESINEIEQKLASVLGFI